MSDMTPVLIKLVSVNTQITSHWSASFRTVGESAPKISEATATIWVRTSLNAALYASITLDVNWLFDKVDTWAANSILSR
ncbi:MAG: hypothetical protein E6X12_04420 [Actinomyces sp.]|nr:hypothetical protein [Actinomyces sp.]MDU5116357.1 hypothetical protein [Actinomyces sp.]MDU5380563.1 hypothetical protein [Actinomyces sp.]MDU6661261.1 hypothetical protein [Actinomyces sp.]